MGQDVFSPEKIRIEAIAQKVELLFGFCVGLIPDIDLLEKTAHAANQRESFSLSASPILEASGINYEEVHFEMQLRRRRAEALVNLLKVLDETEKERIENKKKYAETAKHREHLKKMFGL